MFSLGRNAIYLVTDGGTQNPQQCLKVVRGAIAGGVRLVQLRDKGAAPEALVRLGRDLLRLLQAVGGELIINDHIEVARELGVGVHLGQDDEDPQKARDFLGPNVLVGQSVDSLESAVRAQLMPIDYIAASPIFRSVRKPEATPAWTLESLSHLVRYSNLPVVGIGGIKAYNAREIFETGAGIAVIGAIYDAADPEEAARSLWNLYYFGRLDGPIASHM